MIHCPYLLFIYGTEVPGIGFIMKYAIRTIATVIATIVMINSCDSNMESKNEYEMGVEISNVIKAYEDTLENIGSNGDEPLRSAVRACNVDDSTRVIKWEGGLKELPAKEIVLEVVNNYTKERDSIIASIRSDYGK